MTIPQIAAYFNRSTAVDIVVNNDTIARKVSYDDILAGGGGIKWLEQMLYGADRATIKLFDIAGNSYRNERSYQFEKESYQEPNSIGLGGSVPMSALDLIELRTNNRIYEQENTRLTSENMVLKQENIVLKEKNESYKEEVYDLKKERDELNSALGKKSIIKEIGELMKDPEIREVGLGLLAGNKGLNGSLPQRSAAKEKAVNIIDGSGDEFAQFILDMVQKIESDPAIVQTLNELINNSNSDSHVRTKTAI